MEIVELFFINSTELVSDVTKALSNIEVNRIAPIPA